MGSFSKLVGICVLTASLTIQALHFDIELSDDRNGGPSVLASPNIYDDTQRLMSINSPLLSTFSAGSACSSGISCEAKKQCPFLTNQTTYVGSIRATHYCGMDIAANNYMGIQDSHPDINACIANGANTPKCNGIVYNPDAKNCFYYQNALTTNDIVPVSSPTKNRYDAVLFKRDGMRCPTLGGQSFNLNGRQTTFYCGKAIGGNDYCTNVKKNNLFECATLCSQTRGCVGGDYLWGSQDCYLKTAGQGTQPPTQDSSNGNSFIVSNVKYEVYI